LEFHHSSIGTDGAGSNRLDRFLSFVIGQLNISLLFDASLREHFYTQIIFD
jgi:hypothetical protein